MKKIKPKQKKPQEPKQQSLKNYALNRLAKSGVHFSEGNIDEYYLKLPRNITTVSPKDLGEYLYAFTQQKGYLRTLVSLAEIEVMQVQKDYDDIYSRIYNGAPVESVNDKKEYAKDNKLVRDYREQIDRAQAVLTLASANMEALTDMIFTISREITRREKSDFYENREQNVQNKRRN